MVQRLLCRFPPATLSGHAAHPTASTPTSTPTASTASPNAGFPAANRYASTPTAADLLTTAGVSANPRPFCSSRLSDRFGQYIELVSP